MKKLFILIVIASAVSYFNAQDLKESEVPSAVKTAFTALYPNETNVKWEKENLSYEAEFKKNSVETSVLFNKLGTLIQTETEIPVSSLPQGVSDYVSKNLNGSTIKEACKITSAAGEITYEAEVGKADYIFDVSGNFLNKEVETNPDGTDDDKN